MLDYLLAMMVLGGPLFFLVIFVLLSVVLVTLAWRVGRSEGRRWGRWVAFWLLLFAFWDTPLVLGYFGYQCWANAGFHEYKSVEQWQAENPGVAETLVQVPDWEWLVRKKPPMNQRFEYHSKLTDSIIGVQRKDNWVVDVANNEVMARYVDFRTFDPRKGMSLASPRAYKFWLNWESCEGADRSERIEFNGYLSAIQNLGRKSHGRE